jgi:eukaryotic-like serine/threonine-protein kinase
MLEGAGSGRLAAEQPHSTRAVSAPTPEPGSRFKHYEILRELGRGGMGRVMVARDLKLARKVALKFLTVPSPDLAPRFLIEAQATARCSHENIVVIHEVDEYRGHLYMALELLEGRSLAELLQVGPVSPEHAVELMLPVVRALAHAHALDIVHCDLKPENIFITSAGLVKVLDFGVAKLLARDDVPVATRHELTDLHRIPTGAGGFVGTLPYMSPEQWGLDDVDHQADIWAVGLVFWELLVGRHPLDPLTVEKVWLCAAELDRPMPSIAPALPSTQARLADIVDHCLAKRKAGRYRSASELLDRLGEVVPTRSRPRVAGEEYPFPGLCAFQESDADRFFGRARDAKHVASRVRERPLVGVIGGSGVGKSSFVQAGLVPMLRGSGASWDVLIARPGRRPLASLAALLDGADAARPAEAIADQLRAQPGHLGAALRARAERQRTRLLVYIDQFEELYTLTADADERRVFVQSLAGAADDPASPLRVIISMRSDFIDRVAEDRAFMDQLGPGLVFLPPPDREGLRDALVQPLELVGFRFETPELPDEIVSSLQGTTGALPLLQFVAGRLWDDRDRDRRMVTRASYEAMGGVAGTLANHADQVLAGLSVPSRRLTRALFQRLVTSDRTRAIIGMTELADLSPDPSEVGAVVDTLVGARLLIVQNRGQATEPTVEIVHESLIHHWPTLRRWLDESHEDAAFLEELRHAAKQWDAKGRAAGLLWTGDIAAEAQRFARRYKGDLGARDAIFLNAVIQHATRESRRKRRLLMSGFLFLIGLIVAAGVALLAIRDAERTAHDQRSVAVREADRARAAERAVRDQLLVVQQKEMARVTEERRRLTAETERESAKAAVAEAQTAVAAGREQLALSNEQLHDALTRAREAAARAEALAQAERAAKEQAAQLLDKERARVKELEKQRSKIVEELE